MGTLTNGPSSPPRIGSPHIEHSGTRANALLDSVLNSIPSPSPELQSQPEAVSTLQPHQQPEAEEDLSGLVDAGSGGRSASALQNLADALFGFDSSRDEPSMIQPDSFMDHDLQSEESAPPSVDEQHGEEESKDLSNPSAEQDTSDLSASNPSSSSTQQWFEKSLLHTERVRSGNTPQGSPRLQPNLSASSRPSPTPSGPTPVTSSDTSTSELDASAGLSSSLARSMMSNQQLILDVSRKAAEATAALKSPSQANLGDPAPIARRK